MKNKKIVIKYKLNTEVELPQDFIDSIPSQGQADDSVRDIQALYDVQCDEKELIKFLSSYGAWSESELQDHGSNIDRLIWLSCLDCQEQRTLYFYMGY